MPAPAIVKDVYTLKAVDRPGTTCGYTFLVVRCDWNTGNDVLGFTVDGYYRHEWYRRGSPIFKTWAEGCEHARVNRLPHNDF